MKIWLPYIGTGGGADVFSKRLASGLEGLDYSVILQRLPRNAQFFPWRLRWQVPPHGTDVTITETHSAFALKRSDIKLIAVEHHCELDPAYALYRSLPQAIYHNLFLRHFKRRSLRVADSLVAVSQYTADSFYAAFGGPRASVIPNGVETDFFCPGPDPTPLHDIRSVRLLFVGNLTRRKGADLLPRIMSALGPGYELRYTTGLRTSDPFPGASNMIPLGRLSREQLREEYRRADLLLFPTRLEGFGYAAAEAMACGTPVIATNCSALPELIDDGSTGQLCPIDDVGAFVKGVRNLTSNRERLLSFGKRARKIVLQKFDNRHMAENYDELLKKF